MRSGRLVALFFLGIVACGKSGRMAEGTKPTPPQAHVEVPVKPLPIVPPDAAPLVVRGTVQPTNANSNFTGCAEVLGARHGTTPLTLKIEGQPQSLYVFAKALGPIGIASSGMGGTCAVAGANKWARIEVSYVTSETVTIPIMDVDVAGERRGQTSPYVVVVSEKDEEPKLEPDARPPIASTDLLVRWSVTPRKCAPEIEMFRCAAASIEITDAKGNVLSKMPIKGGLTGQLGCWPDGTGVHCGGPSGMTVISLEQAKDASGNANGNVTVATTSQSDGYCPPPEDCASRAVLGKLTVPPGRKLIPDPKGTWPAASL